MTVNTSAIKILLSSQDQAHVELANGLSLQILPSIAYLPTCQVHHFAAFIQDTATLVVWGDDPTSIVTRVTKIEEQILTASLGSSKEGMMSMSNLSKTVLVSEKQIEDDDDARPRKEVPRRVAVFHAILTAFTLALMMTALGSGWRQIAVEIDYDHSYLRLAFIAVMPLQAWLGLFFFQSIVGCVAQLIGPISQTISNSKFYSGTPPIRPERNAAKPLPHVTIQCPVYKEGLHSVIMPTVQSLKAAISMYEMQGGSANIFINDDGMQLISEHEAQLRRDFYAENHIGWVARPKHNTDASNGEPVFIRPGRFKKASNMNYALSLSARVEEKLSRYNRAGGWTQLDEEDAYVHCLQEVLHEDNGRTWAEGSIRIGDYILLIDSDTRVPVDCFMDPVTEMEQSPEVAIIQFPSGVLNITHSFFENGISFFTTLVYTAISYVVACGDICPFVGHNAFLRWSAIQEVAFQELDQSTTQNPKMVEKFWSENTVSEDFDLALRLQTVGYTLRLAYYKGYEFKEGVSLTVYDELARWKKYAYGCSELIFHPLYYWPTRGPFTPLFRKFIASGMPLPSKVSVLAYVGTYYAIGSAYLMITANFFLVGWYAQNLDHYYIDSFRILFSILIVFSGVGMFAIAILRYRIGEMHFLNSLWQNVKWVLLLYIFFGGISMHVSGAILSHMFGVNMQWGATMKEVQDTTFFVEIGKLLKRFWATFLYCTVMIGVMVYLTEFAPPLWQINEFIAIVPLSATVFSHFLMPIALNPSLMLFTW
jgi:cellulose synthase/poly-beta-1,6-N-acetylglucosamine synthase-like glycosyltransferase